MSPVSFFLFVNIVRVMDIQLHIPIISLLSQTETFLQFLLKFLRDKYELCGDEFYQKAGIAHTCYPV